LYPCVYARRTLNNAYVILDEAQNATAMQMKMFLTRLGPNSKAIITGDITQIDLPTYSQADFTSKRYFKNVAASALSILIKRCSTP
jgi:phosphate starvation-inducible PhoH-like protein